MDTRSMLTLLTLALALHAHAFRLDPMVVNLPLKGAPQASGTYVVENNDKEKVAVQLSVHRREISREGKEERPVATGFLVYPEQLSLEPGEKRSVRVTWVGEAMPTSELAFRFVASQLPVEFAKPEAGGPPTRLKFLMEYVASLYVVPPGVQPKMRLVKHEVKKGKLELTVANEGGARFLLDRAELKAKSRGRAVSFSKEAIDELRSENILAKSERLLRVSLPAGVTGPLEVDLAFAP